MQEPTRWTCGCRTSAETVKTSALGEATVFCTRSIHRGSGDGMHEQIRNLNWGPTCDQKSPADELISRRRIASGSDEAIVSDDPTGHDNPLASQGPLGRMVHVDAGTTCDDACPCGQSSTPVRCELSRCISRGHLPWRRSSMFQEFTRLIARIPRLFLSHDQAPMSHRAERTRLMPDRRA